MPTEKLIAYYTCDEPLDESAILQHLKRTLPDYMVPAFLVNVAAIPITPHGKLDVSALPAPRLARGVRSVEPVSELEATLRRVWAGVLELNENDIAINADFFDIGGSSLLAIRLVRALKAETGGELAIADAFVHRTIRSQAAVLFRSAQQGLTILNSATDRPCLFMVHPAHAGSDVYASIAARLERHFYCIGIESHNLRYPEKIHSLRELGASYVGKLEGFLRARQQRKVKLFGWSLGGQIALEMASALEASGVRGIEVFVVDTVLPDERLFALWGTPKAQKASYRRRLQRDGFDAAYSELVLDNFESDRKLSVQDISRPLADASVVLIKATSVHDNATAAELTLHEYVTRLPCNNIDRIHQNPSRIRTVTVPGAHHFTILQHEDEIVNALCGGASATLHATG
jgi:thioesterase domain-containing protein